MSEENCRINRVHATAEIKTKKPFLGERYYYFTLIGTNGRTIGGSAGETYTQKHNVVEILEKYFPSFKIVDKTLK